MSDKKIFRVNLEDTKCAVGIIAVALDDNTSGIMILRGNQQPISEYADSMSHREETAMIIGLLEEVPDIHMSESALLMAALGRFLQEAMTRGELASELDNMLGKHNITRN